MGVVVKTAVKQFGLKGSALIVTLEVGVGVCASRDAYFVLTDNCVRCNDPRCNESNQLLPACSGAP